MWCPHWSGTHCSLQHQVLLIVCSFFNVVLLSCICLTVIWLLLSFIWFLQCVQQKASCSMFLSQAFRVLLCHSLSHIIGTHAVSSCSGEKCRRVEHAFNLQSSVSENLNKWHGGLLYISISKAKPLSGKEMGPECERLWCVYQHFWVEQCYLIGLLLLP